MSEKPTYEELEQRIQELEQAESKHKRVAEVLHENEERCSAIFKHISSGVAVYQSVDNGEDFIFKAFNDAAERITRIPRDKALGNRLLNLFPQINKTSLLSALQRVWKTGQAEHLSPFYYKDETREGWRENRIFKLPTGEIVSLFNDITEFKQTAAELLLKNLVFETAITANSTADTKGILTNVNNAFIRTWGYESKEEAVGKPISEFFKFEEDAAKIITALNEVGNWEGEYTALKKDGTTFDAHGLIIIIKNESEDILGYQFAALDISEKKLAEKALTESEERYTALFERSFELVYLCDFEGNFIDANNAALEGLGYTRKDINSLNFMSLLGNGQLPHAFELIEEILKTGSQRDVTEYKVKRKDGRHIYIESKGSLIYRDGKPVAIQGIGRNITSRKRAEKALMESEEKYRIMMEAIKDLVYICSSEFRVEYMNPTMIQRIGRDATGEFCFKAINDLGQKCPWCMHHKTQANEYVETDIVSPKDNRSYHTSQTPVVNRDGSISNMTILRDTTDWLNLESQLRQSQKMEAIGVLAGGVAHDFNNILTTIIGNAQLALMDIGQDGPLREEIEEIKTAVEKAASLTRQLLAFSRKQIIQPKILDFNELLAGMEKMLGRLLRENIEIQTIPGPELLQVNADPGQMEQVIMNLVVNARDAMPKGGKLTVETANIKIDKSYFRKHGIPKEKPGTYVVLSVSDTGIGMDKETQEHIFEPFYTTKEIGKGTGLGLSTLYGIVKQGHGFIWVYSEPGQGSTFKVYLPKAKGDVKPIEEKSTSVSELGGSETILIVEDNDGLRKFAQIVLRQLGYKVLEAENGEDALRISAAHDGSINLVITDVVMPKMGGKETAKQLQPLYPQMKELYMSGYTENAIVHDGVLATGLNFIEKPFSREKLARKVRKILDTE